MKKLFIILALVFFPALADATTWYAGTGGTGTNCTQYQTVGTKAPTIAAGLACMTAAGGGGHTLYITAGTYTEAALVPPSGTSIAHNTIASYGSDTVTFTGFSGNIHAFNFYSGNFHWVDFVGGCTTGINRTCRMTFDGTAGGSDYSKAGIVFSTNDNSAPSAGDLTFDGVRITKFPGLGFSGGANITVRNSRIDYTGTALAPPYSPLGQAGYAFYIHGRYVIENNEIDHSGGFGIHLFGTEGTNNYIFRFNYIHDNGITASDNNPSGIILATPGTSGHMVYGNVIWGGINGVGIEVRNCSGCLVYNNTVYNNQNGGIATGILGGPTNTQVKNNIVSGNGGSQISNDTGIGTTWATNLCSAAGVGCDATLGTEAASATFNNPGVDFTLKAGSKAINAGTNLGASYSPDIANVARPTGGPWEIGAYEYGAPPPVPEVSQLVLALPLDEGEGATAVDVSGQKNNAALVGGVSWDNVGVFGKAIMLDGTGYLNVPASSALALAPAMTVEAWIYPTVTFSGFATILRQDRYYLYAASDAGYCPAGPSTAPLGGYSTMTVQNYLCATSLPPINQWSHLAVTHDGATTTVYLNGNIIASQPSTDAMVPTANNMTIGASQFGEYFVGKIDQPMVYNYARTRPQILSDMNTPLIGAPGKYVEIAAPVSVEISAASSLEISAD